MYADRTVKFENKKNLLNPNISFDLLPHHIVGLLLFFSEGTLQRLDFGKGVKFCSESLQWFIFPTDSV